jgi:hypothetical protein
LNLGFLFDFGGVRRGRKNDEIEVEYNENKLK